MKSIFILLLLGNVALAVPSEQLALPTDLSCVVKISNINCTTSKSNAYDGQYTATQICKVAYSYKTKDGSMSVNQLATTDTANRKTIVSAVAGFTLGIITPFGDMDLHSESLNAHALLTQEVDALELMKCGH